MAAATSVAAAIALVLAFVVPGGGPSRPSTRSAQRESRNGLALLLAKERRVLAQDPARAADAAATAEAGFAFRVTEAELRGAFAGNLVYSPSALAESLTELELGAGGSTARQLAAVLGESDASPALQAEQWNALSSALARTAGRSGIALDERGGVLLDAAHTVRRQYLDEIGSQLGAGVWRAGLATDPAGVRAGLAQWASAVSGPNGRSPLAGAVSRAAGLMLAGAYSIRAPWAYSARFVVGQTRPEPFHLVSGATVTVPTMQLERTDLFAGTADGATAVVLPYRGGHMSAVLVEPTEGSLSQMLSHWGPGTLDSLVRHLGHASVTMDLPRFSLSEATNFATPLRSLGASQAFSRSADFSGMTPGRVSLGAVTQSVSLRVNEDGTNAAVNAAPVTREDRQYLPMTATFDRPFLFLVRDNVTGAILFEAAVMNPELP